MDTVEAPEQTDSKVAAKNQQTTDEFVGHRDGANHHEVEYPVKYDLKNQHWGDSPCLFYLQ
jgi:hypothetical protein